MNILVILRNIYSNPDLFDDEQYLCKSDCNVLAEAMMLKELFTGQVTALLFAETIRTYFPDYDLILFGRLAYDGDAVNVSTQVSCHLGIPRVVYSQEIYTKDQVLYARKYISSSKEAVYRLKRPVLFHRSILMIC